MAATQDRFFNSGLFGNTKAKRKRGSKASGTKGDNRGRAATLRSYCPICPPIQADPELSPRMSVTPQIKIARCPSNHRWLVGSESLPTGQSRIISE